VEVSTSDRAADLGSNRRPREDLHGLGPLTTAPGFTHGVGRDSHWFSSLASVLPSLSLPRSLGDERRSLATSASALVWSPGSLWKRDGWSFRPDCRSRLEP
jgi:hypothetical protein